MQEVFTGDLDVLPVALRADLQVQAFGGLPVGLVGQALRGDCLVVVEVEAGAALDVILPGERFDIRPQDQTVNQASALWARPK